MTNPANDPILTVRVHPDDNRAHPAARRRIRVVAGQPAANLWMNITGYNESIPQLSPDEWVENWSVQPLAEVARILGHPAPTDADRCPSCDHSLPEYHQSEGCWHSVIVGTPGKDTVCPCSRPYTRSDTDPPSRTLANPVPVEDTDIHTCEFTWDGTTCALTRGHEDPWHEDAHGMRYHDDEPVPAAPSTVDSSIRERIKQVFEDESWDSVDGMTQALLAALPELDDRENERLHSEIDRLTYRQDQLETELTTAADTIDKVAAERDEARAENAGLREDVRHAETAFEAERKRRLQLETDLGIARGAAKQYRLQWENATAANARLLDDPKTATAAENATLRAKLAERNKAYGRASVTIGQLRSDLARKQASCKTYENAVRRLEQRALDEARRANILVETLGKVVAESGRVPRDAEQQIANVIVDARGFGPQRRAALLDLFRSWMVPASIPGGGGEPERT